MLGINLKTIGKRIVQIFYRDQPVEQISIVIPFGRSDHAERARNLEWVLGYLEDNIPEAQVIVAKYLRLPFSKTAAWNKGMARVEGDVVVLLDADALISAHTIRSAAEKIRASRRRGLKLWIVPYRNLYRLTSEATDRIIYADGHNNPYEYDVVPPLSDVEDANTSAYGHRYGAMCMIIPVEAYDAIGCFDERFKSWGGEDISTLRALDTLYAKHKTLKANIFHLWHPKIGSNYAERKWNEEDQAGANNALATRYHRATRNRRAMSQLVREGCAAREDNWVYRSLTYIWDVITPG